MDELFFQRIDENGNVIKIMFILKSLLVCAQAVGVKVGHRSGGRLATTLVATKNVFIFPLPFFPCFSSVTTFSHRRIARIKKLILGNLTGAPKT